MPSFTYIRDIPFASHNPSVDQPNMQTNTNSIDDLLQVDHVSFNNAQDSGKHLHVTLSASQSDPVLVNGQAQIYPKTFGSPTAYLETYTASKTGGGVQINGYLPFVKAMCRFTGSAGPFPATLTNPIPNTLFINIASIVQTSAFSVTITFTTALPYNTYYVFAEASSSNGSSIVNYTRNTNSLVLTLNPGNATYGIMVI